MLAVHHAHGQRALCGPALADVTPCVILQEAELAQHGAHGVRAAGQVVRVVRVSGIRGVAQADLAIVLVLLESVLAVHEAGLHDAAVIRGRFAVAGPAAVIVHHVTPLAADEARHHFTVGRLHAAVTGGAAMLVRQFAEVALVVARELGAVDDIIRGGTVASIASVFIHEKPVRACFVAHGLHADVALTSHVNTAILISHVAIDTCIRYAFHYRAFLQIGEWRWRRRTWQGGFSGEQWGRTGHAVLLTRS